MIRNYLIFPNDNQTPGNIRVIAGEMPAPTILQNASMCRVSRRADASGTVVVFPPRLALICRTDAARVSNPHMTLEDPSAKRAAFTARSVLKTTPVHGLTLQCARKSGHTACFSHRFASPDERRLGEVRAKFNSRPASILQMALMKLPAAESVASRVVSIPLSSRPSIKNALVSSFPTIYGAKCASRLFSPLLCG